MNVAQIWGEDKCFRSTPMHPSQCWPQKEKMSSAASQKFMKFQIISQKLWEFVNTVRATLTVRPITRESEVLGADGDLENSNLKT